MRAVLLVPALLVSALLTLALTGTANAQPSARMPLTIVSAPSVGETGPLTGARFAEHVVRPSQGIVLDAEVRQGRKVVPAGTVLARVESRSGFGTDVSAIYCDVRPLGRWSSGDLPCFSDRDGDGLLDHAAAAMTSPAYFVMGVNYLRSPTPLASPVAFRPAAADQMPTSQFAFRHCLGPFAGQTFEITVPLYGSDWQIGRPPCPFVPRETADGPVIAFQGLRVRIDKGPNGATWTIVSADAPGTELSLSASRFPY
jgi:hypothetical protein